MGYFDEEEQLVEEKVVSIEEKKPKKEIPFVLWEVGGETFKLKLRTSDIVELEDKFKCNLMQLIGDDNGMPPLTTMLMVTHAAMKKWHHSIKKSDVINIFEKYIDEGGSQIDFFTNVYTKIFTVSGFFSQKIANDLEENIQEANDQMQQ